MAATDYTDFYILDRNYNKFNELELIEDDIIRLIVQKYQIIIYTNKGEVLGDLNLGANLVELLYETKLSAQSVQEILNEQIKAYIPEILQTPYELTVIFEQDPSNYQDIMMIDFKIDEYQIVNQIGNYV